MSKVKVSIWDRDFELAVSYQNFPEENITDNQQEALAEVPSVDYDMAKTGVAEYIRKHYPDELGEDNLDNIFRLVLPRSVLIPRFEGKRAFAIMCDFKLDMEHGIAIVFEDGKFKTVGSQDIIL